MNATSPQRRFAGRVVLVSGASRGIGSCTARALAREGAHVVLAARDEALLGREAAELRSQGADAMAVQMDVTNDASVLAAIARVHAHHRRIDLVINNAGNGGALALWEACPPAQLRDLYDVHVFGAERVLRAVLPIMRAQGGGTVVQIASTVGWVPMPGAAAYSSAKAAVIALSEVWRAELAISNVDVRVFAPPHTRTEAGEAWPLPLPKVFEPSWVADRLLDFLASKRPVALVGGNTPLLWLQRLWPAWAASIMRKIGFTALARVSAASAGAVNSRRS